MRAILKAPVGEVVNTQTRASIIMLIDIIRLLMNYFISRLNLQHLLFLLSFLTYGVGDGITAVYMMDKRSVMHEINPIILLVYISYGGKGVVIIKIWSAFIILFLTWLIARIKNIYWTVNGFLFALFIGGIMAMRANLMTASGITPPSPGSIIITFLSLTILFMVLGDQLDKLHDTRERSHAMGRNMWKAD